MLHEDVTRRIIGCFFRVYNELGQGFLESVYETSMAMELHAAGLRYERQSPVLARYRGRVAGEFRADFVVEGVVVLELKAGRKLEPAAQTQLLNYLRATSIEVGLLLNFGERPAFRRLIHTNDRKPSLRIG